MRIYTEKYRYEFILIYFLYLYKNIQKIEGLDTIGSTVL